MNAAGEGVNQGDVRPSPILTDPAGAAFRIGDGARLGTELALDPMLLQLVVPRSLSRREIVAVDEDTFHVIERDNQGGPDATIKRIYSIDTSTVTFRGATATLTFTREGLRAVVEVRKR